MKDHAPRAGSARPSASLPVDDDDALDAEPIEAPVNLNAATEVELRTLPGIGPTLAARIVTSRALEGLFTSPEDLRRVQGVTPKLIAKLGSRVVAGSPIGCLVPRRRDDVVIHWSRAPRPAPRVLLLPAARHIEDDEIALDDDELEEVAAPTPHRRAAPSQPPSVPPRGPLVIEELPPSAASPHRRLALGLAAAIAVGVMGLFYGPRIAGYAEERDVKALSYELASDVRELKADRQQVHGRLDRLEPVGAELPKAAAQIDALNASVQAQREESEKALVEAQATVKRLRREVGILRDAVHGAQRRAARQEAQSDLGKDPSESGKVASGAR